MSKVIKLSPLFIIALALIAVLVYLNLAPEPEKAGRRGGGEVPVIIQTVERSPLPIIIEALGTANANESVIITAQETETVTNILFDDGDIVEKGQLLLELNNRAEKARLNEIEINLAEAQRQLKRIQGLAKQSAASQQLLDEQRARVEALLAQREVAKAELQTLHVTAPFGGKLGVRQVSLGSLVRPGDVVTTLDDLSVIKLDFTISEIHLASVLEGQRVIAKSAAFPDMQWVGTISNIDSRVNPSTRSIQVRANINNDDYLLRPGMLLQLQIEKRVLDTLVVNESALVPEGEQQFVYVVNDGSVTKREVFVGERMPGVVEIQSGLELGEQVVVQGTLKLREGAKVNVLEREG